MGLLNIIFEKPKAKIGTITVDAAISINHSIASTLTKNPVEDGAKVTDHVELEPQAISIQGVISDTPLDFQILNDIAKGDFKTTGKSLTDGINSALGKKSRSTEQYEALMTLWKSREPFEVITGLKVYKNMILTKLDVEQTATTGRAIHFTADMEEIRIVSSKVVGKENFQSSVKNLASKKKNLGTKVSEKLDPVKDQKKSKGSSALFEGIKTGKLPF